MEKQGDRIRAAMDRIVTSEALTHELKRTLEDLAHSTASKADISRMTGLENVAAGLHKKLEELTSQIDNRHLSQHTLLIEGVEQKMYSIEPIIKRVENLEKYLEESQTFKEQFVNLGVFTKGLDQKLVDSNNRQSSLHQQLQENLERRMTVSTSLQERVATLENQITKHPKRLGPITDLASWRKLWDEGLEEPVRENTAKFWSTFDQVTQWQKEVQGFGNKPGDVATAGKNLQIQQGKEHTELIEEKMSIAQREFDKMVTELKTQLSNMASQAAKFESLGEQNGSRDYQIDDLVQSNRLMMMRVAALEKNEKHSDEMMMMRLAALEEKNEKQVCKIVELERANEKLQREVKSLRQPVV
ncbi:hypothetical protein OCU04_002073 [Sclerotinia nivalis]|uniref:Uncharacterized protein n=1 Tax=Sclerotinia nivalis TaxID=352851 RepID=A0A9X0AZE1_9HELO|nr:hypothetical protein OCU04_002073 [Sclerotinia nivalis]